MYTARLSRLFHIPLVLCALSQGCGGGDSPSEQAPPDGDLLPLAEGNTWTYRVTDGSDVTEKVVTVGKEEKVGGTGPNKNKNAFKTSSKRVSETTFSWQARVDGKVVRYRDETIDADSGDVKVDEFWAPYRLHVDGSEEHTDEGASWLEQYTETATKSGKLKAAETVRERWTVVSSEESVTVPAGTFDAVVLQKAGGTKLKTYWYVPGIGKVKETGGQTEELVDYELAP